MNLALPLAYMGPMPWYLQVEQFWGELWSELKIFLVLNHVNLAPLEFVAIVGGAAGFLGLAVARKL
jgi:hypothetical protein